MLIFRSRDWLLRNLRDANAPPNFMQSTLMRIPRVAIAKSTRNELMNIPVAIKESIPGSAKKRGYIAAESKAAIRAEAVLEEALIAAGQREQPEKALFASERAFIVGGPVSGAAPMHLPRVCAAGAVQSNPEHKTAAA